MVAGGGQRAGGAQQLCAGRPSTGRTSTTCMRPSVTVPVLSITIVVTRRVRSSASGPRITMPSWAPRPVPTSRAVGVARPSAQGQATISTATAACTAAAVAAPLTSQPTSVPSAITITTGTKISATRSARRWAGPCRLGLAHHRPIRARAVSAPTRGRAHDQPAGVLTVAPVTWSPGATSTGTLSPVIRERSTAECPPRRRRRWRPARRAAPRSRSPTWSRSIGTRSSWPSETSTTSFAPTSSRPRRATAGLALGPVLEVAAGQDQRGHDRRHLEVGVRRRRSGRRPTRRRRSACRSRSACPWSRRRAGVVQGGAVEGQAAVEDDGGGEHERRRPPSR